MLIADNVIAQKLRNVYWILRGSCGGKTTAAKQLVQKYGFHHYNGDEMMWTHCQIAVPELQPAITRKFNAPEDKFLLPPEEYHIWQSMIYDEMTDMIIADLIGLSAVHEKIVFEGEINNNRILPIITKNHAVHLYADNLMVKRDFFDRPDNHIYDCIKNMNLSSEKEAAVFDNFNKIICGDVEPSEDKDLLLAKEQGWFCYQRTDGSTIDDILQE